MKAGVLPAAPALVAVAGLVLASRLGSVPEAIETVKSDAPQAGPPEIAAWVRLPRPTPPSIYDYHPIAWSPDGRWLSVVEMSYAISAAHGRPWEMATDGSCAHPTGSMEFAHTPSAGGESRTETERPAEFKPQVYHPDGDVLGYVVPRSRRMGREWRVYDRTGRLVRSFTWPDERRPSPSGRWWVLSPWSQNVRDAACTAFDSQGHRRAHWVGWSFAAWLPGEERMLLSRYHLMVGGRRCSAPGAVYGLAGLADHGVSRLTPRGEVWQHVTFAPHGRWMVYDELIADGDAVATRTWVATVDMRHRVALKSPGAATDEYWLFSRGYLWSPDSRKLAIGAGNGKVAVWIVTFK